MSRSISNEQRTILLHHFVRFLKEKNIYVEFRQRFVQKNDYFFTKDRHPSMWIMGAFIWPLGSNWWKYSHEWSIEITKHFN